MTAATDKQQPQSTMPPAPITVTPSAIRKVFELMQEENNLALKLRIFITGGGCSGFQYGFGFEEIANADDIVIEKTLNDEGSDPQPTIQVLIDAMSLQYLMGAKVDYRKDINGEQFVITGNPKAKTTCGCGSSFSADDEEGKN